MPMDVLLLLIAVAALTSPITIAVVVHAIARFVRALGGPEGLGTVWLSFASALGGAMMGVALTKASDGMVWFLIGGAVVLGGVAVTVVLKRLTPRTPVSAAWETAQADLAARTTIDLKTRHRYEQYATELERRGRLLRDRATAKNRKSKPLKDRVCSAAWWVMAVATSVSMTVGLGSSWCLTLIPLGASLGVAVRLEYAHRRRIMRRDGRAQTRAAEAIRAQVLQLPVEEPEPAAPESPWTYLRGLLQSRTRTSR